MGDENKLTLNVGAGTNTTPQANKDEEQAGTPAGSVTKSDEVVEDVSEVYLINGIEKYQLDRWLFEGGMLILTDPKEIKAFEKVWNENKHRGYAARITQVDDSDLDVKTLKDKLVAKAIQGAEDSEKRARQLNPAG